jgi:hypothetical protein
VRSNRGFGFKIGSEKPNYWKVLFEKFKGMPSKEKHNTGFSVLTAI